MSEPRSLSPVTRPGQATAEEGVVLLDGPSGVAVAMTPEAAVETARSLCQAAHQARTQMPAQRH